MLLNQGFMIEGLGFDRVLAIQFQKRVTVKQERAPYAANPCKV